MKLPSTLKRIEYSVFEGCSNLRSIKLPDNLEYIGKRSFMKSGLSKVQIPKTGVKAEGNAFIGCPAKESIVFRDGRVFPKD